jgi:threonine dehydratase
MPMFSLAELEAAVPLVRREVPATPLPRMAAAGAAHRRAGMGQARKPHADRRLQDPRRRSLSRRAERCEPAVKGIVTATRGNHGQSVALAASSAGFPCTLFVPHGNSREKNRAMQAFGAELAVVGADFDEAREHAAHFATERGYHFLPSFHPDLVKGRCDLCAGNVQAVSDLDAVYVPIGMGLGHLRG